jgi:Uma2 family endonuclease
MAVMDAPRTTHWNAGDQPRAAARTGDVDDPLAELEELFWTLDIPGHRVELLEGQIVVSPMSVVWHGRVANWLARQFDPVCQVKGWDQSPGSNLLLPPTRDIIVPDQIIFKDPDAATAESAVPVGQVLLVSEICSPSSVRADREVKPLSCAKAGIPFYLLVDRFTEPMTVTLLSEPGKDGYGKAESVPAGPGGGKLAVPEPFGITSDVSTVPQMRAREVTR